MPMANSLTLTPKSLAVMKWPHSWTAMSSPKSKMPTMI